MELELLLMAGDTDSGETGGQAEGHSLLWALPGSWLERVGECSLWGPQPGVTEQGREGGFGVEQTISSQHCVPFERIKSGINFCSVLMSLLFSL